MNADIFSISGILYLAAMVCYLFYLLSKKNLAGAAATFLMISGALCGVISFVLRYKYYYKTMETGLFLSFPVTNMFESVHFCILCTIVIYLVYEFRRKNKFAGLFVASVAGIGILSISLSNFSGEPALFVPALQSYWLLAHVLLSFVSYACFVVAAGLGVVILVSFNKHSAKQQDEYVKNIKIFVSAGFVLFTIGGLIFGAIWANSAWGRFWSWDPKESWAFITWCVYLLFIHLLRRKWPSNKMTAVFSVCGLIVVLFTFLGVNILLSGLHSYGNS